jgi:ankyrin repeat protein
MQQEQPAGQGPAINQANGGQAHAY